MRLIGVVCYIALLIVGLYFYLTGDFLQAAVNYALAAAIRPDYSNA